MVKRARVPAEFRHFGDESPWGFVLADTGAIDNPKPKKRRKAKKRRSRQTVDRPLPLPTPVDLGETVEEVA